MKTVSLLHIGDIHYPDEAHEPLSVDHKDTGLSTAWGAAFAPNRLKQVSDQLRDIVLNQPEVVGVLLSGDLTSRGDVDGYESCVNYLRKVLELDDAEVWKERELHVVPGNHDVVRTNIGLEEGELFKKFEPIAEQWQSKVDPDISFDATRRSLITRNNCQLSLFSINTCMGCGEKRFLPKEIREELHRILEATSKSLSEFDAFDLVGERLDTPAILEEHLGDLEKSIFELDEKTIPVILGHHGLLPQAVVRMALYTELLNGGGARFRLSSLDRAVMYLHGHIHHDPIETVLQPAHSKGGLIIISAPLYSEGFNLVRIHYTRQSIPIGCEVVPYRVKQFGAIRKDSSTRVPLCTPFDAVKVCDDRTIAVLGSLPRTSQRFKGVLARARNSIGSQIQEQTLANALLELEWLGLVEVRNREEEPIHWQVTKVGI